MKDCIDTFFRYVKGRIIQKNPQRTVVGIVEANSWPPKNVDFSSFYLMLLGVSPNGGTISSTGLAHLVQWMWIISGTDINQTQIGNNRGDRYALNMQMKEELEYGLFPYFCDKNTYTPIQQGNKIVATPSPLNERIWWNRARFIPTSFEKQEGIIYGGAQVSVGEWENQILS